MEGRRNDRNWRTLGLLVVPMACSAIPAASPRDVADANDTGRTLAARSQSERAMLGEMSALPSGAARRVGSDSVLAEAPYSAASGRICRALHITTSAQRTQHRLACSDGRTWFFVPDVFGAEGGERSE